MAKVFYDSIALGMPDDRNADEVALGVRPFHVDRPDVLGEDYDREEEKALASFRDNFLRHAKDEDLARASLALRGGLEGFKLVRTSSATGEDWESPCGGGCILMALEWEPGMLRRDAAWRHRLMVTSAASRSGDTSAACRVMTWWDAFPPERTRPLALAEVLAEQLRRASK